MKRVSVLAALVGLLLLFAGIAWAQLLRNNVNDAARSLDVEMGRLYDQVSQSSRLVGVDDYRRLMQVAALRSQAGIFRELIYRKDLGIIQTVFSEIERQAGQVDRTMRTAPSDMKRRWRNVQSLLSSIHDNLRQADLRPEEFGPPGTPGR